MFTYCTNVDYYGMKIAIINGMFTYQSLMILGSLIFRWSWFGDEPLCSTIDIHILSLWLWTPICSTIDIHILSYPNRIVIDLSPCKFDWGFCEFLGWIRHHPVRKLSVGRWCESPHPVLYVSEGVVWSPWSPPTQVEQDWTWMSVSSKKFQYSKSSSLGKNPTGFFICFFQEPPLLLRTC